MDGLTVSNSQKFLEQGRTVTDLRKNEFAPKTSESNNSAGGISFSDTLKNSINEVNRLQKVSDIKTQQLATGETKNIPEVMIAAEKADIALRLMVQVRNKVMSAYNEIMKMQV